MIPVGVEAKPLPKPRGGNVMNAIDRKMLNEMWERLESDRQTLWAIRFRSKHTNLLNDQLSTVMNMLVELRTELAGAIAMAKPTT